jgi:sugar lactone lactonase YvrE
MFFHMRSLALAGRSLRRRVGLLGAGLGLLVLASHCGGYTQPTLPGPVITSFAAAKTVLSVGASTTLTADFSNGLGEVDDGVGPVMNNVPVTVTPAVTTTYTLTDSDASGAFQSRSVTIQVVAPPTVPVIVPPASVEPGLTGLEASVTPQDGCTYLWTINPSGGTITAGADSPTVTFSTAGYGQLTLSCTVTNLAGTTVKATPLTFLLGGPTIDSFAADPATITVGGSTVLAWSFSGGAGVITSPGGLNLPVSSTGSTSVTESPAATTTYTLTVTSVSKPSQVSTQEFTVTVVPAPSISLFGAAAGIIGTGATTQLNAVFDPGPGGSASVDNGAGAVQSGVAVTIGTLEHSTVFTLTVANAAGTATTATAKVLVGSLALLAGTASGQGSLDGALADARYRSPAGMVLDSGGNLLVADTLSHTVRMISPAGQVSTWAGLEGVPGNVDALGVAARFNLPVGLALDPNNGTVYVADSGNNSIRMIDTGGNVTTVPGTAAQFKHPTGVAAANVVTADNPNGSTVLFVADTGNDAIWQIQTSPGVTIKLLNGTVGVSGDQDDPNAAGTALFNAPAALVWDGTTTTTLYVADAGNNSIRQVAPTGMVTTVAGDPGGAAGSADTQAGGGGARFFDPQGLAVDGQGNLFIADTGNSTLRQMVLSGSAFTVTTVAGTAGTTGSANGSGGAALFNHPQGLAVGAAGNLDVADTGNATIRQLPTQPAVGAAITYSGTPDNPGPANGTGADAQFRQPCGAALDAAGNLYLADAANHIIRMVAADGTVSTLAGTAGKPGFSNSSGTGPADALFNRPTGVAVGVDNGNVYLVVADTGNNAIRKVLADGTVSTLAGDGTAGSADSVPGPARFNQPAGVALDPGGDVLVADQGNNALREILPDGTVSTLAGAFSAPAGVVVAPDGTTLYVADTGSATIRQWAGGAVTVLAGSAGLPGSVDGTGTEAQLDGPTAIALDPAGNLYVTNQGSSTVSLITPAGVVTTIIGSGVESWNNPGPLPALISPPYGIAVASATGNILITLDDAAMLVDFTK